MTTQTEMDPTLRASLIEKAHQLLKGMAVLGEPWTDYAVFEAADLAAWKHGSTLWLGHHLRDLRDAGKL